MLPVFTRGATHVDPDGNTVYDLRPMIGAYAVSIVKYVAMFALHGAVIGICFSIFMITPETAAPHGPPSFNMQALLEMVAISVFVILISMLLGSAKVVGLAIKFAIESVDEAILGVEITVQAAALAICRGYVNVTGLVINNPGDHTGAPSGRWSSGCLAKVDSLIVKINIGRLICSLGGEFEINVIELTGVHVNFEKKDFKSNSNVQEVLEYLDKLTGGEVTGSSLDEEGKKKKAEHDEKAAEQAAEAVKKQAEKEKADRKKAGKAEPKAFIPTVLVHEVNISGIRATAMVKGFGGAIEVQPIVFEDFMEHLGDASSTTGKVAAGTKIIADIVGIIVGSVMRSVAQSMRQNMTKDLAKNIGRSLSSAGEGMTAKCADLRTFIKRKLGGASDDVIGTPVTVPAAPSS
jgi:hypothetical protein